MEGASTADRSEHCQRQLKQLRWREIFIDKFLFFLTCATMHRIVYFF